MPRPTAPAVLRLLLAVCVPLAVSLPLGSACAPTIGGKSDADGAGDSGSDGADGGGDDGGGDGGDIEDIGSSSLTFDHAGGWVEAPFELVIETPLTGAVLVYTLDCSDPLDSSTNTSRTYDAPLVIDTTTVVRVATIRDGEVIGPSVTRTFVFADQIPDQTAPDGWPSQWSPDYGSGGWSTPHYSVAAEVVDADPDAFQTALAALPMVSLVLDPEDLWGASGIYDHAWEEGVAWERPAAVELFAAASDGAGAEPGFAINSAVRIYGGASRNPDRSPKKTFRLLFKGAYGPTKLEYRVYPDDEITEYDGLVLRGSYNHSWIHWDPTQRSRGQLVRDPFARATQRALGGAAPRGRHVHLFLDGLYWGVYDIAERADATFFADRGGGTGADWDVLNSGEAIDGDTVDWAETLAVARADDGTDAGLAALEARVDADALIDYMLMNLWAGNDDWPHHNWYAGRERTDDGRWRFVSWDAEHTLKELDTNVTGIAVEDSPAELFVAMARHPPFVARLSARAAELMGEGGPLAPAVAIDRYDTIAEVLAPAMVAESARWGTYRRDVYCFNSPPCEL